MTLKRFSSVSLTVCVLFSLCACSFKLQTRFDILGTRMSVATYKANETTGIPEMVDKSYTFIPGRNITTTIPQDKCFHELFYAG